MPPVIIPAVVAAAGAFAVGATTAVIIGTFVTSLVMGFISSALAPKPKSPQAPQRQPTTQQVLSPVSPRTTVYGFVRVSGTMVFYETTENNTKHHMIVTIAGHEVDDIPVVMIGEDPIYVEDMDGSGNVNSGKYNGKLRIKKHFGAEDQTVDTDLSAEVPLWTSAHRLRGVAYLYIRFNVDRDLFPSGYPLVSAWVRGRKVEDLRDASPVAAFSNNAALVIHDYLLREQTEGGAAFLPAEVDNDYSIAAANICDEEVTCTPVEVTVSGIFAASDYVESNEEISPLITGDRVNVISSGSVPSGLGNDMYIIIRRYKVSHRKVAYEFASSYENAMAGAAVDITDAGSGTITIRKTHEPRYTFDGHFSWDEPPYRILDDMRTAFAGYMVYGGPAWRLHAGAYATPTITYDEDDMRSEITVDTRQSRKDRFNSVKGQFTGPLSDGVDTSYPAVRVSGYVTQDNGIPIYAEINLPYTSRSFMAQRIARVYLERIRRQETTGFKLGIAGLKIQAIDTFMLDNDLFGYSGEVFEAAQWSMRVEAEGEGAEAVPMLSCDVVARQMTSDVFDFAPGDETAFSPRSRVSLFDPKNAAPPTGLTAESGNAQLYIANDGTVTTRIKLSWSAPADAFVRNYELEYYKTGDPTDEFTTITLAPTQVQHYIGPVEDGVTYTIRMRSVNIFGVQSSVVTEEHTVQGKSALPGDVDTFNVSRMPDGTRRFTWMQTTVDPDVRAGGGYRIKAKVGTGHSWADLTAIHTGLLIASPFETNELAAGVYTFGIKAVDSSGNESENAVVIEATLGDPRLRNVIFSRVEYDQGWPGTKTDCFVNFEGFLEAESLGGWSGLPSTWSSLGDTWLELYDSKDPIEYTTLEIDLGADLNFNPLVTVDAVGTATITMQIGTDADGQATGSFVSLAPVEVARYLKIKVSVTHADPLIRQMIVLLDTESRVDDYEDINTAAPSSAANPDEFESLGTGHFKIATRGFTSLITQATITAFQNAGAGWTWELLSKATTITGSSEPAAEFQIYQNGSAADAVVDIQIKGPKKSIS